MNDTQDLSIIQLILEASLVVKLVMVLLTYVSLMSWYWIFRKWFALRDARLKTEKFERDFWSGGDLNSLYQSAVNDRHNSGALERIFEAGFREFTKSRGQKSLDASAAIDGVRRAMRATYQREVDDLEAHLAFLASVGSVSPYVGLFGTVWGIMNSFRDIGRQGSANLATVAPGIAEALVATAFGLLAAIPAVVLYNYFLGRIKMLTAEMDNFSSELLNIIERYLETRKKAG
jgi:biopolymer transport protein TolQ